MTDLSPWTLIAPLVVAVAAGGCIGFDNTPDPTEKEDAGPTIVDPDARPTCPNGRSRHRGAPNCYTPPLLDVEGPDTEEPDTGVPPDSSSPDPDTDEQPDTSPDTGPTYPSVGQRFNGPTVTGSSEVSVEEDYGVGLYWRSALSQFPNEAANRRLPNWPVVTMSRISSPVGEADPIWKLPKAPPADRHYYKNYCEEAGEQTCSEQGIDDEKATFALMMLGIHRAPPSGKASDCKRGMIRHKTACDYGTSISPSPTHVLLYAYRKFNTANYPVFDQIGIPQTTVPKGYHYVLFPAKSSGQPRSILKGTELTVIFDADEMFPMIY